MNLLFAMLGPDVLNCLLLGHKILSYLHAKLEELYLCVRIGRRKVRSSLTRKSQVTFGVYSGKFKQRGAFLTIAVF